MLNISNLKNIISWILYIIIAIIIALLIRYFFVTPTVVKNVSMKPTLIENNRLILNRAFRTFHKEPQRFQIVTFEAPSNYNTPNYEMDINDVVAKYNNEPKGIFRKFIYYVLEINKVSYIKRVIGLPGEHLKIYDGKVYINDELLTEDYLANNIYTTSGNGIYTDVIIPDGYVFVMGDNRPQSSDSRKFGCIPIEKIESSVSFRFWPLNVFGKVH